MPSSVGLVFVAGGIAVETLGVVVFGVALMLAGLSVRGGGPRCAQQASWSTTARPWSGCTGASGAKPWTGPTCGTFVPALGTSGGLGNWPKI
jgi:hypothetical protein